MTELLFRDDAYLKTASARVVAVNERGIELDRTIFYAQGGGQVGDTGVLLRANGERIPSPIRARVTRSTACCMSPRRPRPGPKSARHSRSRSTGSAATR